MAWVSIAVTDLLKEFNSSEKAAYDGVKGDDSLQSVIDHVVARIRQAVFSGGGVLDPDNDDTIPEGLGMDCIAIARWNYLLGLPKNEALLTSEREKAYQNALDHLAVIAAGDERVESGDPAAEPTVTANTGAMGSNTKIPMRTDV